MLICCSMQDLIAWHAGVRTPALAVARPAVDHHFPGSSESSLSQPYEDARSRSYTPKTAASLLDFDSPSNSPGSPARANWQPTLSPLADVTTDAGGIATGESSGLETERWASMEPDAGEHLNKCRVALTVWHIICCMFEAGDALLCCLCCPDCRCPSCC